MQILVCQWLVAPRFHGRLTSFLNFICEFKCFWQCTRSVSMSIWLTYVVIWHLRLPGIQTGWQGLALASIGIDSLLKELVHVSRHCQANEIENISCHCNCVCSEILVSHNPVSRSNLRPLDQLFQMTCKSGYFNFVGWSAIRVWNSLKSSSIPLQRTWGFLQSLCSWHHDIVFLANMIARGSRTINRTWRSLSLKWFLCIDCLFDQHYPPCILQ